MSREWVKLHTSMLGHVGTMRLSDRAFRVWIVLLMMAGQADDDGRVGTLEDVVWYFRPLSEDKIRSALDEMRGRVVLDAGVVYVRDWAEWQPKADGTNAERQAKWRANQAEEQRRNAAGSNASVTPLRNGGRNTATRGLDPLDPSDTYKPKQDAAPPAPPAEPGRWQPIEVKVGEIFGCATRDGKGKVLARVGAVLRVLGSASGDDPGMAMATLDVFRESEVWPFVTLANFPEKLSKWQSDGRPAARSPRTNGNHNPAIKADDDRTETPLSPEERERIVAETKAKYPNAFLPSVIPAPGGAT